MLWWRRLKKYKKSDEDKLKKEIEEGGGLEKHDLSSLIGSAFITIIPICLLVLCVLALVTLLVFRAI